MSSVTLHILVPIYRHGCCHDVIGSMTVWNIDVATILLYVSSSCLHCKTILSMCINVSIVVKPLWHFFSSGMMQTDCNIFDDLVVKNGFFSLAIAMF